MEKRWNKLIQTDVRLFYWINHRWKCRSLDVMMRSITHLGGAVFTIFLSCYLLFFRPDLRSVALHVAIALAASHLMVQLLKRRFWRIRPHLALSHANTVPSPLVDSSFPSGHPPAFFSIAIPFAIASPPLAPLFLGLATTVALSRIYLGLHYPSDVSMGALLGASASFAVAFVL